MSLPPRLSLDQLPEATTIDTSPSTDNLLLIRQGTVDKKMSAFLLNGIDSGGDVNGPLTSTDNALARYDGQTGKIIQDSNTTLDDAGNLNLAVPLNLNSGGTGQTSYSMGDILYSPSANGLTKLAIGSEGQVLTVGSSLPSWITPTGGGSGSGSEITFSAFLGSSQNGVTGDSSIFTPKYDQILTNVGGGYDALTGKFTAPATGNYFFSYIMVYGNVFNATGFIEAFATTNSNFNFRATQATGANAVNGTLIQNGSCTIPMTSGDTIQMLAAAYGTSKEVNVLGGGVVNYATTSMFSGFKINGSSVNPNPTLSHTQTFTSVELKDLKNNPILVLPAPGINKFINIKSGYVEYFYGGTSTFDNASQFSVNSLLFGGPSGIDAFYGFLPQLIYLNDSDSLYYVNANISDQSRFNRNEMVNQPIYFAVPPDFDAITGNPENNNSLKITFKYTIEDLS